MSAETLADLAREPPNDAVAERSVLGALILSAHSRDDVIPVLNGRDFYQGAHAAIYAAITGLVDAGDPVDAVTVVDRLAASGDLPRAGGRAYIHTLIATVPAPGMGGQYAGIVQRHALRRRMIEAGVRVQQLGYTSAGFEDDAVAAMEAELLGVTDSRQGNDVIAVGSVLDSTFDDIEAAGQGASTLTGVPAGFIDLDKLTNGLHPGQLVLIAARPAIGKSTLGLDICRSASIHHQMTSVMFSLEMSRKDITMRLLSAEARVQLQSIRSGAVTETDWVALARARARIDDAPLFIDDGPNMTIADIRSKCRRLKQQHDLKVVVVDYLQLMTSGKRVESRQQEVSEFSRALKLLAKELEVPVVALSQLNRGPEQRQDKKPAMSDLRESGSLEQDADVIILLHREDAYEKESPRAGEADFIVAKHRNGPTDTVTVAFQGHYSRFADMAPNWRPEPS